MVRFGGLVLAALALTGCFHDGEGDASDRFRERANAVCRDHDARVEALGKPPPGRTADRERERWERALQRVAGETVAAFESLEAPGDVDPALAAWLRQADVLSRRAATANRAAKRLDTARISASDYEARAYAFAKAGQALQEAANRWQLLARRAGLNDCVDDAD